MGRIIFFIEIIIEFIYDLLYFIKPFHYAVGQLDYAPVIFDFALVYRAGKRSCPSLVMNQRRRILAWIIGNNL